MTKKHLTKTLYQPSIPPQKTEEEKAVILRLLYLQCLLTCSRKAEVGWHCYCIPGLSHIIHWAVQNSWE